MRRGLGTPDETEAEAMVGEMNTILRDQTWWNAAKRQEAALRFSTPVIEAFYDEIQAGRVETEALRESHIRLPDREEGFPRVLFVGTTGAGKTSLLRQLIGSDPDEDRFPSTAPAKTTIADIEVIQAEGDFEAVVTFFTEFQTQANIEECVIDAALAVLEKAPMDKVADRFLSHRDQKFRLSYILGGWRTDGGGEDQDDMSFEEASGSTFVLDDEAVLTEAERTTNREVISTYLERVAGLTKSVVAKLSAELGVDIKVAGPDRDVAQQLIEENFDLYLTQEEAFHELVQDILEDVRGRFDFVSAGQLQRRPSRWPELWVFSSTDRREFIRHIRWFSSNYWPQFGRLLTPLVDGIRVRGPLFPDFLEDQQRLVLIDGQGLGHTPDSSSSVTTHVTRRFGQVDVILLVDNAQQPMQAAPLSVLRAIASSGHHRKLAVAFTHFDQIKGQNFQKFADKRAHVMASVLNALSGLRDVLGVAVVNAIERGVDSRCFMLGGVDRQLAKLPPRAADYMRAQLSELVGFFRRAILPPPPAEARPVYDPTGVGFAVQDAVSKFQGPWLARLGIGTYEGFRKEHWTRVKALNRRIAGELDDEYDTLRPIADLATQLRESISRFLNNPIGWTREPADEEEAEVTIDHIRQVIEVALRDLAVRRLVQNHLTDWRSAYDGPASRGTGSTFRRATAIQGIYDAAAPLPDAVMTEPSAVFLGEIRRIVTSAIEASGGEVRLIEAS
jgi:GTP-binding protein EngB required for normal cell division